VELVKSPFIKHSNNTVQLISPTFGDKITIHSPRCDFGTSKNGLRDLQHVEGQIRDLSVLPDFGYSEDNYILGSPD
jgi:hypothetical protein